MANRRVEHLLSPVSRCVGVAGPPVRKTPPPPPAAHAPTQRPGPKQGMSCATSVGASCRPSRMRGARRGLGQAP
eukprot:13711935-Alexandrium_andersonii.AAC.1